ncbi:bifunctional adenosylcobinamide kinase/adenosylcobinamide-phosphate guanylyltransferase [Komagataeibacter sp. FNDCR2]|uniref:bifunctional adenosylcobinamide kinase/adenosylcobinamide-phosphate guanylyltransferase n=1 Tax=Komagataeibacter sp. FNDCR2 TaxID=2878682 RepID=UPI001E5752CF|nr:bifunctional adenosylcobinamide kinase/adenosylcobinamide-phosphate guanylyltransferase [Komagataeibacter sp. FNDCR2]MCE2575129.1 bifunctional adenosylcobinamide kinase/adenosylcobinamide-phosphate guanylyltransferase [Komagataeibacter sp. FNDCR2]
MKAPPPRDALTGMKACTLVLGGARSGKSRFAEGLFTRWPTPWNYIATCQPHDAEMAGRVAAHQTRRGDGWRTFEAPLDVAGVLDIAGPGPVLVDCLTLWLTNLMLGGHDIAQATRGLLAALARRSGPTVLVSSEVGQGIVPDNALARRFRDEAGLLHQAVAHEVARVVFVVAGLPMELK